MMDDLTPPPELNDGAKAEWRRIIDLLGKKGFIEDLDRGTISAYVEAYAEFHQLSAMVKKTGPVLKTEKGNWTYHPVVAMKNQAAERLVKFSKDLGLTPWSRSKMDMMEKEAEDEFTAFIKAGKAAAKKA